MHVLPAGMVPQVNLLTVLHGWGRVVQGEGVPQQAALWHTLCLCLTIGTRGSTRALRWCVKASIHLPHS